MPISTHLRTFQACLSRRAPTTTSVIPPHQRLPLPHPERVTGPTRATATRDLRPSMSPGRSGLLGTGLGEGARPQVGAGAVVVEDAQDLRGSLPHAERMRLHRGELG